MFNLFILISLNIAFTHPVPAPPINLMTYNIRFDNPQDGSNKWDNRKATIIGILENYQVDILGIQEGLDIQVKYIKEKLPKYSFVGVGREDGKKKGEYSAIFYRKDRFKLIVGSTFWLSDNPLRPSKGWDAALERICTYALFQDSLTKNKFWVFNTHFDHIGVKARENSAKLIISKIAEFKEQNNYPAFIIGDLNTTEVTEPVKTIKTEFFDSKELSRNAPLGPNFTFNNFNPKEPGTERIDFIFVEKKYCDVSDYIVIDEMINNRYPSDHFPVLVKMVLL
jgi:endonuclease/exonuclease/phosphatase family metal-dependent hydrolase